MQNKTHPLMKQSNRDLHLVLLGVFLGLSSNSILQGQSADSSLKLHLSFDRDFSNGHVVDVSGNGNDGWQFNPTNWIASTNGVFGSQAAQFTVVGTMTNDYPHVYSLSQYIAVTNLNGFEYLTNGTISYWAQFDGGNFNHEAIFPLDCGTTVTYALSPSQASNSWSFWLERWYYVTTFYVYPASSGAQPVVSWPKLASVTTSFSLFTLTVDCPNDQAIAYFNGSPYQTNVMGMPWIRVYGRKDQHWLCIGAMSHDGTPQWGDDRYPNAGYMSGRMDDIRIYNRTLSAAEVKALYYGAGTGAESRNLSLTPISTNSVTLSWDGQSNSLYQAEYRSKTESGTWTLLGSPTAGGNGVSVSDSFSSKTNRFYRVRPLP